jgi:hypothetical protein
MALQQCGQLAAPTGGSAPPRGKEAMHAAAASYRAFQTFVKVDGSFSVQNPSHRACPRAPVA